jgi:hypothetical protein
MVTQLSTKEMRPNPFNAYRDPQTGKWIVVKPEAKNVKAAVA